MGSVTLLMLQTSILAYIGASKTAKDAPKKMKRRGKPPNYAGIKVKKSKKEFLPQWVVLTSTQRYNIDWALSFSVFRPCPSCSLWTSTQTSHHLFLVVPESACARRLRLIGFCYLCNCFNHPITISCERGKKRPKKKKKAETGKQREGREKDEAWRDAAH